MQDLLTIMLFAVLLITCESEEKDQSYCDLPACDTNRKTLIEVTNQIGTLKYDDSFDKFTITYLPENAIDSYVVALVCNLPIDYDEMHSLVIFDGELKDTCGDPPPILGKDFYYLHLKSIKESTLD